MGGGYTQLLPRGALKLASCAIERIKTVHQEGSFSPYLTFQMPHTQRVTVLVPKDLKHLLSTAFFQPQIAI